jgi:stage III sporulation protein AB
MLLILAGCLGTLLAWRQSERRKQAMMEECIRLFSRWCYGVKKEKIRLYDFWETYETNQPPMGELLQTVCEQLQQNCYASGQQVWRKTLSEQRKQLLLTGEAYTVFCDAGDGFFAYSSKESLRCMEACQERMEQTLLQEREEFFKKQRIYMPAGMMGGMILIILLV